MGIPEVKEKRKQASIELESLVFRAQQGDDAARTEIVLQTKNGFFKFCVYVTGNEEFANDLFQDSYIKAFQKLSELEDRTRFMSWLCRLAKNLYLDMLKLKKNEPHYALDVVAPNISASEKDSLLSMDIQTILAKLPEEDRIVLTLVDMSDFSYQEAAEVMGTSEAAVRSRLHRARKEFAELYKKQR